MKKLKKYLKLPVVTVLLMLAGCEQAAQTTDNLYNLPSLTPDISSDAADQVQTLLDNGKTLASPQRNWVALYGTSGASEAVSLHTVYENTSLIINSGTLTVLDTAGGKTGNTLEVSGNLYVAGEDTVLGIDAGSLVYVGGKVHVYPGAYLGFNAVASYKMSYNNISTTDGQTALGTDHVRFVYNPTTNKTGGFMLSGNLGIIARENTQNTQDANSYKSVTLQTLWDMVNPGNLFIGTAGGKPYKPDHALDFETSGYATSDFIGLPGLSDGKRTLSVKSGKASYDGNGAQNHVSTLVIPKGLNLIADSKDIFVEVENALDVQGSLDISSANKILPPTLIVGGRLTLGNANPVAAKNIIVSPSGIFDAANITLANAETIDVSGAANFNGILPTSIPTIKVGAGGNLHFIHNAPMLLKGINVDNGGILQLGTSPVYLNASGETVNVESGGRLFIEGAHTTGTISLSGILLTNQKTYQSPDFGSYGIAFNTATADGGTNLVEISPAINDGAAQHSSLILKSGGLIAIAGTDGINIGNVLRLAGDGDDGNRPAEFRSALGQTTFALGPDTATASVVISLDANAKLVSGSAARVPSLASGYVLSAEGLRLQNIKISGKNNTGLFTLGDAAPNSIVWGGNAGLQFKGTGSTLTMDGAAIYLYNGKISSLNIDSDAGGIVFNGGQYRGAGPAGQWTIGGSVGVAAGTLQSGNTSVGILAVGTLGAAGAGSLVVGSNAAGAAGHIRFGGANSIIVGTNASGIFPEAANARLTIVASTGIGKTFAEALDPSQTGTTGAANGSWTGVFDFAEAGTGGIPAGSGAGVLNADGGSWSVMP
jgi:hypothetical protein